MSFNSCGGSGTHSSPIVIAGSDSESGTDLDDDDGPIQLRGSPLKVIQSGRYRSVIDTPEVKKECLDIDDDSVDSGGVRKKLRFSNEVVDPVYENPPPKYSAERVLKILLDPTLPASKICSTRPTQISKSGTYIINISKLEHPDDVKKDSFGVWVHSGSHPQAYKVHTEEDGFITAEKCGISATGDDIVYLRRLHSIHPTNNQFKRMIAFLSDASNNPHHLCLVVYHIPPGFTPTVKKHGNSKEDVPFHPTWSSTKQRIKEECVVQGPKSTVTSLSAEMGGVLMACAPGQLPRNEKQVSNFKAKVSMQSRMSSFPGLSRDAAADNLFVVMQQAYTEDPSRKFVRAVNAAPEPAVVVATNRQLKDLARFCTMPFEFSVITVDPTFTLGDFDVTLILFCHLFLQSKRFKRLPVFVGPACIHYKKSFPTYLFFASSIIGQCRELEGVRALGTDGEHPLIHAFKHEFGFAQHLTCSIHVRQNVKDKLRECNIPTQFSADILEDVFGKKLGTVYVEGLVDASDTTDFHDKLDQLVGKWRNTSHPHSADIESFISWFLTYKAPVVRDSMLRPVREECGLGSPPDPFTTSASETANSMLKNKVDHKRNELPVFLQKLKELVQEQEHEVEKAIIGRGKYELRPQYQSWHVPETKWFAMTTPQREAHLRKFSGASVSDVCQSGLETGNTESPSSLCFGRDLTTASSLSVDVSTIADVVRVPRNSLEGIWSKAAELLKIDDAIVSAPGVGADAKFVLSYSGQKGGAFACDSDCPNWKGLGICAHSVAAAELCGKLLEFVTWYKKAKKSPNLSKFAEATMPKGRGRKGGKGPQKRNSSVATTSRIQMPVAANPLVSSDCTLQDHLSASQISQTPECSSSSDGLAYQQSLAVSRTNTIQLPSQSNTQENACYGTVYTVCREHFIIRSPLVLLRYTVRVSIFCSLQRKPQKIRYCTVQ